MAAEMMPETAELQKQFTAARVSGDYATMESIGRQLYPEPAEGRVAGEGDAWSDKFLQQVAAKYRAHTESENSAPTFTRAALKVRVGELRKAPMLEPAFRRDARLVQLKQAQRQLYEQQPLPGALSL